MRIRVLLADDSDMAREAMRKVIAGEPRIEIVGDVANFAQTVQAIAELEPAVLLLDLHLAEKRAFTPALVKSQLACVHHILAVSFSSDAEARDLAQSYGAKSLLDKMRLFNELVPAILECRPTEKYLHSSDVSSERLQAN